MKASNEGANADPYIMLKVKGDIISNNPVQLRRGINRGTYIRSRKLTSIFLKGEKKYRLRIHKSRIKRPHSFRQMEGYKDQLNEGHGIFWDVSFPKENDRERNQ